jgi:pimeloyl-ACP methyl ester carboxylesterase
MKLAMFEWGESSAPPLVLIHGVGGSHEHFIPAIETQWACRYRVIAVDLRGHGSSGYVAPFTTDTFVDDVVETLLALGVGKAQFVGHSFGGRILLRLIARYPELVHRAVATEPVISTSGEFAAQRAQTEIDNGQTWPSMRSYYEFRKNLSAGAVDYDSFVASYGTNFDTLDDGSIRRRAFLPALVSIFTEFPIPATTPEQVTVPLLIVYGEESDLVTPKQRSEFAPAAKIVKVPGQHAVFVSAFKETTEIIAGFLE